MQLNNRLEKLHGKSWMFRTKIHKVIQTRVNEDTFEVVTNHQWFTFLIEKADAILKEFLPVDNGSSGENSTALVGPAQQLPVKQLSDSLSNAINKLDSGKPISDEEMKMIDRLNKTSQTMINLGKLQLDIYKQANRGE